MARLFSCGFELNSLSSDVEITANSGGSITTVTTPVRSGRYALGVPSVVSGVANYIYYRFLTFTTTGQGPFFYRTYLYIATYPAVENDIFDANSVWITLTPSGTLKLNDTTGVVGSASSVLSLNTWYMVEMKMDQSPASGSRVAEARLDGSVFATTSTSSMALFNESDIYLGGNIDGAANATGAWYFDDVAINDSTGTDQTSYPGSESFIYLRPKMTGDNMGWTNIFPTLLNYGLVNRITPKDGAGLAYVSANSVNTIDDYTLDTPPHMGSINVLHVGIRLQGAVSSTASFVLRIKTPSSGTVQESAEVTFNSTIWTTNANTLASKPYNYLLTLYDLPGASTAKWTWTDLLNAQIGIRISTGNTNLVKLDTIWLVVGYKPRPKIQGTGSIQRSSSLQF